MPIEAIKLLVIVVVFFGALGLGIPVAFIMGGLAVIFTMAYWGVPGLGTMAFSAFDVLTTPILFAIPLFIFMGNIIRYTRIGDDLFDTIHAWMGGINGGLAMGTVVICTVFAAMTGIAGAATVTMALIAIPSMAKHGYDKSIYVGCVAAGGLLGLLIPPSTEMILYCSLSEISLGKMYLAGVFPGLLMSGLFVIYIGIRCHFQPHLGPAIQEKVSWRERFKLLRKIVMPVLLVGVVLGGIYSGTFTPTEASGIGATGAMIIAIIYRTLNRKSLLDSVYSTLRIAGMVFWLIIGATCFSHTLAVTGIGQFMTSAVGGIEASSWFIIGGFMGLVFIMGMMMSDTIIVLLMTPICVPIMASLGVNQLWWGLVFVINMIIAWITPPYGFNLFMMRLLVPEEITMGDIYRSVIPFVGCMLLTLVLCMIFPEIILFLPHLMFGS